MRQKKLWIGQHLKLLYKGFRHPATPWWAKGLVVLIVLYGISPMDFMPDTLPIVGWLDDASLLLLLFWGWEHLLPPSVRETLKGELAKPDNQL